MMDNNIYNVIGQQKKYQIYEKLSKQPLMITTKFLSRLVQTHENIVEDYVKICESKPNLIGLPYLLMTRLPLFEHVLEQNDVVYDQITLDNYDDQFIYNKLKVCADAIFGFTIYGASYAIFKYEYMDISLILNMKRIGDSDVFYLSEFTYEKPLFLFEEHECNVNMIKQKIRIKTDGNKATCNNIWIYDT